MRHWKMSIILALWSGQKPGLRPRFLPGGSLALTPAHTDRPNSGQASSTMREHRTQSSHALCAILKGIAQIFWPLQRMPVSPTDFQTAKILRK